VWICAAWLTIDAAFELGQKYGDLIAPHLPAWFEKVPVLDQVGAYFTRGTYDGRDLVAIAAGALAAALVGELTGGGSKAITQSRA
jgi:hypothetical protein